MGRFTRDALSCGIENPLCVSAIWSEQTFRLKLLLQRGRRKFRIAISFGFIG